jgi:hypothetical protein
MHIHPTSTVEFLSLGTKAAHGICLTHLQATYTSITTYQAATKHLDIRRVLVYNLDTTTYLKYVELSSNSLASAGSGIGNGDTITETNITERLDTSINYRKYSAFRIIFAWYWNSILK